jgi:hypothetical protein
MGDITSDVDGTSDNQNPGGGRPIRYGNVAAVALGALSMVLIIVIALVGLRTGDTTTNDPSPSNAAPSSNAPLDPRGAPRPRAAAPTVTDGDPEVTAWHDAAAPVIGPVVVMLSQPPTSSLKLQLINCNQLKLLTTALSNLEEAPIPEVDQAFSLWVVALSEAVEFCLGDDLAGDEQAALRAAQGALIGTAFAFDAFLVTINPYLDIGQPPAGRP